MYETEVVGLMIAAVRWCVPGPQLAALSASAVNIEFTSEDPMVLKLTKVRLGWVACSVVVASYSRVCAAVVGPDADGVVSRCHRHQHARQSGGAGAAMYRSAIAFCAAVYATDFSLAHVAEVCSSAVIPLVGPRLNAVINVGADQGIFPLIVIVPFDRRHQA